MKNYQCYHVSRYLTISMQGKEAKPMETRGCFYNKQYLFLNRFHIRRCSSIIESSNYNCVTADENMFSLPLQLFINKTVDRENEHSVYRWCIVYLTYIEDYHHQQQACTSVSMFATHIRKSTSNQCNQIISCI